MTAIATTVAVLAFVLVARLWWKRDVGSVVIGSLGSSYVNAGNLGIPLAVYVFADASYVAPVMLYQLVVLAPIAFVALDIVESGRRPSWRRVIIQPIRNPVIIASVLGIVLAATGTAIPELIYRAAQSDRRDGRTGRADRVRDLAPRCPAARVAAAGLPTSHWPPG